MTSSGGSSSRIKPTATGSPNGLLRERTEAGDALAEIIDHLSLDPDLRRRVARWKP